MGGTLTFTSRKNEGTTFVIRLPLKLPEKMVEAFRKTSTHDKKIRDAKTKELLRFPGRVFDQDKEES